MSSERLTNVSHVMANSVSMFNWELFFLDYVLIEILTSQHIIITVLFIVAHNSYRLSVIANAVSSIIIRPFTILFIILIIVEDKLCVFS